MNQLSPQHQTFQTARNTKKTLEQQASKLPNRAFEHQMAFTSSTQHHPNPCSTLKMHLSAMSILNPSSTTMITPVSMYLISSKLFGSAYLSMRSRIVAEGGIQVTANVGGACFDCPPGLALAIVRPCTSVLSLVIDIDTKAGYEPLSH